jgi:hypothetical protein
LVFEFIFIVARREPSASRAPREAGWLKRTTAAARGGYRDRGRDSFTRRLTGPRVAPTLVAALVSLASRGKEMRALLVLTLFAGILSLIGCATLTETPEEYCYTIRRTVKFNLLEIPEDARMIMLLDRPSRLSRWMIR